MKLISEIVLIELSAVAFTVLRLATINTGIKFLLSGVLVLLVVLHIVFYLLNIHSSLEDISLPTPLKIPNIVLLLTSKLNIIQAIIVLQACLMCAFIIEVEESLTQTNGVIMLVILPLALVFDSILCVFLIFLSNKLDATSNKYFTKKTLFPIAVANILAGQLIFSIVQSIVALGFKSLIQDIPVLSNLFAEPVLYNFIYNLLLFG